MDIIATVTVMHVYFQIKVLTLLLQLSLVVSMEGNTNMSPWLAYTVYLQYIFHRRRLFIILCSLTFAGAMLFSSALVSVPILFFIDRALCIMYQLDLDAGPDAGTPKRRESQCVSSVVEMDYPWEELDAKYTEKSAVPMTRLPTRTPMNPKTPPKSTKEKPVSDSQQPEESECPQISTGIRSLVSTSTRK